MQIAIIGLGEVGLCYARAFIGAGFDVSLCEMRPSPIALDFASSHGKTVHPTPGQWLSSAQWTLSCVTGAHAFSVAEQVVPNLTLGAAIADLTTASPDTKRRSARHATEHGIRYVDTAIMGAISLSGPRTPLLASGEGAAELQALMQKSGGVVQVIQDGVAGDAISLKVLRSIFTKGIEALSVELLMAAEKQGVRDKLYEQLSDIDRTPLRSFLEMLVRTHVVHAERRLREVQDVQGELAARGPPSQVLKGVEQRFSTTVAKLKASGLAMPDPSIDQALEWLLTDKTDAALQQAPGST